MVSAKLFTALFLSLLIEKTLAQDPKIVEATDAELPISENSVYLTLESEVSQGESRGLIEDLPNLEKRIPAKLLKAPRNVTHANFVDLRSNYKYALTSICLDGQLPDNCICSKTYKYDTTHYNKEKDAQARTGVDTGKKIIIISYRATRSVRNWMTNLDYELIPYPGATGNDVKVHTGFYEATLSIRASIENSVKALLNNPAYKGYKLHVTGVSLGAAMSTVSSIYWSQFLKSNGYTNQIEVFSYASPRVGNEGFASYIASLKYPLTRYSNVNDIVTHLPPRSFGFVHVAAEVFEKKVGLGKTELVKCDQRYDEDPNCGLQYQTYSVLRHFFAFNQLPSVPFC